MSVNKGLGKGLDALIPKEFDSSILENNEKVQRIPINKIQPNPEQPRKQFDEESLLELSKSIKNHGIIQPLVITKNGSNYRIIAGERRWRAADKAGLHDVPAIVRSMQELEELEVAIIENVQRVDLSPLEQAQSIERLHDQFSLSYSEIANKLGKAIPTIHNTVRLLQLPNPARDALAKNQISEGHARAILALKDNSKKQAELLDSILRLGWSVRQAEQFVTINRDGLKKSKTQISKQMSAENTQTKLLADSLQTKVFIKHTARGGKLEIYFKDENDMDRITKFLLG